MSDRNEIKQSPSPSESIHTKIEDQPVTDGKTSVRPIPNELIKKRYMNSKLTYPVLIAGFSGPGMIGSICTNYIIEQLQMHQISYVDSIALNSGTTIAFIAITIAVLVLVCADHISKEQHALAYAYHHSFDLNHLPCVLIHGGHVHCVLNTSPSYKSIL